MSDVSLSKLGPTGSQMEIRTEATQPSQTSVTSDLNSAEAGSEASAVAIHEASLEKQPKVTRTVTAQDWNGPDDPENPLNWSTWKRVYHTSVPALLGFLVTLGSSVYTPGVPDIMEQFGVSSTIALLGLTVYLIGLACGPVLAAPLSETLGRKAVYMTSLPMLAAFTLGAGFSQNFATLLICRFFAGFFGSPTLAVGAGTNADLWPPVDRAVATVLFILAPFAGPALGPTIGGYAVQARGWRWTQWPILFAAGPAFVYVLFMKETYKKIILKNRAKRLGIPPPPKTGPTGFGAVKFILVVLLIRPVSMMFTEPIVGFFSLYIAFNFSVLFGFFDAFPIVFEGVYGFDLGSAGLPWIAVLVGCLLAVVTVILIDRATYRKHHHRSHKEGRGGFVPPEHRLYAAMIGSLGLPIGLFWFAWTSRSDIHWISPVLAAVPFAWGNLCVFASAALYLVDTYGPMTGASALAANGLARYLSGAAFPLFTIQMYNRLGIPWATSLLGFISIGLLPIPWVLFKYGPHIRAKSNYETTKA
ncbi:hypothetical protein MMC18_000747 [Xylographa bjoerkii]|nr:hypothetical protein [Xylographa bjoerkii]